MFKKVCFLMLALVLAIGLGAALSFPVAADEVGFDVDGYELILDKETGTIHCRGYWEGSRQLCIPAEYDGVAVRSIGEGAFFGCEGLETLILPDSVTQIGDGAFYGCISLQSVLMPGVISIENEAFAFCESLTELTVPESVQRIGASAFENCAFSSFRIPDGVIAIEAGTFIGCSNLTDLTVPESVQRIGASAFSGCPFSSFRVPDGVTAIEDGTFARCSNLTDLTVPESVQRIGASAFSGCPFSSFRIPDGVTAIEDWTFGGCSKLTDLTVPESVQRIGASAFSGCPFSSFRIPDGVTAIEDWTFGGCSKLTELTIPESVQSIGREAFSGCPFTSVNLPDRLTAIGADAFASCKNLTELTIPESVQTLGERAFQGCEALTSVRVGGAESIGEYTFSGCTKLTEVLLPTGMTKIGERAFNNCSSLAELVIPEGVTQIEDYAFAGCTALTKLGLPSTLAVVGNWVFQNDPPEEFDFAGTPQQYAAIEFGYNYYMNSVKIHYVGSAVTWSWDEDSGTLTVSGSGFMDELSEIPWVSLKKSIKHVKVEPGVESLGRYAFYNCHNLEDATLPEGLGYLSLESFYSCENMKTISIPQSVTWIYIDAFNGCRGLELVMFSGSKEQWDGVDIWRGNSELLEATVRFGSQELSWTFDEDSGTLTISGSGDMPDYANDPTALPWYGILEQIRRVIVEDGVTSIGSRAFSGCTGLETVNMADSVRSIGKDAFSDCGNLGECALSPSLRMIGENAFYKCVSLSEAAIPDSVSSLGASAYSGCVGLTTLHLPEGITTIPDYAFSGCIELTEVTVPDRVTEIGAEAFASCSKLALVTLPAELAIIRDGTAFDHCAEGLTVRGYDRTRAQSFIRDKGLRWESLGTVPVSTVYILPEDGNRSSQDVEKELLEAMQSHTRIVLADGLYVLSGTLTVPGVCDLSIEAEHPGRTELLSTDGEQPVIRVRDSCFVDLSGLILGHSALAEGCNELGIVYVALGGSRDLTVVNCDLWGCGTIAVQLQDSNRVRVSESILRDCKYRAVWSILSEAVFSDCVISGNAKNQPSYSCVIVQAEDPGLVRFQNCTFINNYSNKLINSAQESDLAVFEDCIFHDNAWQGETPQHYGVCLGGVTWEAVELESFDDEDDEWYSEYAPFDLLLGVEHIFGDGSVLPSRRGHIPSYSEYSLPWKELNLSGTLTLTPGLTVELSQSALPWHRVVSFEGAGLQTGQSYQFVCAEYDENGKLTSVKLQEYTFDSSFAVELPYGYGNQECVQIFLLDSNKKPQCGSIALTLLP